MIWTRAQALAIDHLSSQDYAVSSLALMEQAGQAIFHHCLLNWKPSVTFIALAGPGNNGGDAIVAARLLRAAQFDVVAFDVRDPASRESPERASQRVLYEKSHGPLASFDPRHPSFSAKKLMILDGLLGIGFSGALRPGRIAECLRCVAALKPWKCLAIDLPSGLDADAWQQAPALLKADLTLSFGAFKAAHKVEPSRSSCGEVRVVALPFAHEAIARSLASQPFAFESFEKGPSLDQLWQDLPRDAHKFTRGHILIIGGSPGKVGAPLLAAEAALRAGGAWISIALLSEDLAPALPPTFTYEKLVTNKRIDRIALRAFITTRQVKTLVIGPGCMTNPLNAALLKDLCHLQKTAKNWPQLIFDAAALHGWIALCKGLQFDPKQTLLTPHPGEWQRMAASMPALQQHADLSSACAISARLGCTILYKSSTPFSISPSRVTVMGKGSNALAKAGSGDLLAGVASALLTRTSDAHDAALYAQNIVVQASQRATNQRSPHALGPLDIADSIH